MILLKLEKNDDLFVDDWFWIKWWIFYLNLNAFLLLEIGVLSCCECFDFNFILIENSNILKSLT